MATLRLAITRKGACLSVFADLDASLSAEPVQDERFGTTCAQVLEPTGATRRRRRGGRSSSCCQTSCPMTPRSPARSCATLVGVAA
jgi:hypothetical protein